MQSATLATRVCRTCLQEKPLTAEFFPVGELYRGGFRPHCKLCLNARLTAYKAQQRVARGAKPKRKPRMVGGVEFWACKTLDCGWHARSEFYLNKRGTPRPLCKRCHKLVSTESMRTPAARQRIAEHKQERQRQADPERWAAEQERRARRERLAADGLKHCPGPCGRDLPCDEFQPNERRPRGTRARCRDCRNEQATEYARRAWERDPERIRGHGRSRHARVRGAPVSDLTADEWTAIRAAYGDRCGFCGRDCDPGGPPRGRLTQEHDIPVSRGGWHSASNVFPACLGCNASKQDRTADEFAVDSGLVLDRGPHPLLQLRLDVPLPKRERAVIDFPVPVGWDRTIFGCDECRTHGGPLCSVCRRRVQRWESGGRPRKRATSYDSDGNELRWCSDPECERGWQPLDGFYPDGRGGFRRRCKRCTASRSSQRRGGTPV